MRTYEIKLRALDCGGGWELQFFEDGVDAGGKDFPPGIEGYGAAEDEGEAWVSSGEE